MMDFSKEEILKDYPELHHYTDWNGLTAILKHQTLRCTRFDCLNDTTELVKIKETLSRYLFAQIMELIKSGRISLAPGDRPSVGMPTIEDVARQEASLISSIHHEAAFTALGGKSPLWTPYVASFCGHGADMVYEKANGLLSQWRGYGREEPYCIVFDTLGLLRLMEQESKLFAFDTLTIRKVTYDFDDISIRELELIGEKMVAVTMGTGDTKSFLETYLPLAALCKHRGFHEEREVRIVASPTRQEGIENLNEEFRHSPPLIMKQREQRTGRYGEAIEYITLFGLDELPVRRVIVGPHRFQSTHLEKARSLVAQSNTEVHASATPFIG